MLKKLERICLYSGAALVALTGLVWIDGIAYSRSAVGKFDGLQKRVVSAEDQATWSERRKVAYQRALSKESGSTLAILRIESAGIEVPVFDSTSKTALNRGAGHVSDTALPGTRGNIAIAGHRDGFFRGLKDIGIGASIELTTLDGQQNFQVSEVMVVDPLDVSVLEASKESVITLITCYPFYFVGPAPERFIVKATLVDASDDAKPHAQLIMTGEQE